MLVGTVIVEYLYPLVSEDQYLMEQLMVVQFLHEVNENDIAFDTIEIALEQEELTKFVWSVMSILCRKVSERWAFGGGV